MINSLSCHDQWSSCMNCYDQWSFMINVHRFIYDQWSLMIIDHVDHTWSMVFIKPWSIIKLYFYIIKLKDLRIQKRWNRAPPSKTKPQWRGCILCFFKQTNSVICNNRTQISRSYLTIFCNHACQGWLLEILFCGRDAGCLQHTRMQQAKCLAWSSPKGWREEEDKQVCLTLMYTFV